MCLTSWFNKLKVIVIWAKNIDQRCTYYKFKKKMFDRKLISFLMKKGIHICCLSKKQNVNGTVLLFILYSIWVHVERLKYKMICLKSSELATSFNKQWSKILNYVDFIIFNKYSIDFYKIEKFKKYKVTPPVGFEPATSGVWCYETPAQRKLPKTPLTNDILLTILKKKRKSNNDNWFTNN